jgi:methyl-accepting chemotaxis protein
MAGLAQSTGNYEALGRISGIWHRMMFFMSGMSRFANTGTERDAEIARSYFADVNKEVENLEPLLSTESGRRTFTAFLDARNKLADAFERMDAQSAGVRKSLAMLEDIQHATSDVAGRFNTDVDRRMVDMGALVARANQSSLRTTLITGAAGLLLAAAIALSIVIGIVRVLKQVAGYATAVASGNFAYSLKVRERGEIGGMVQAMRAIPAVLEGVIQTADSLARGIRTGKMRDRLNVSDLPGEFAKLGTAVNTVSDAYTDMLDAIPAPVMACDRTFTVLFLNRAGQDSSGGNLTQGPCKNCLNAGECGTDRCFGKLAMDTAAPAGGETEVVRQGRTRRLAVTAIPLRDETGTVSGYFEILNDLTEIRQQQATMMQVAADATEISNRVAAAAEELAAQVEQISRGAEIQRDRVTSTASAMTEMNATVLEVARSAGEASGKSDTTRAKADDGARLVNRVVEAINAVNAIGTHLQSNMRELGDKAEGIGGVMNVISDIADQTNLLALNAAIEAARAGEAGRGFAVVADEVRKLAEKTMEATREVGDNINAIQHSARQNIEEVEKAVESVGAATRLADESGHALQEIVGIASDNSQVVASIATAAEQQSATSEEISRSVDEINRIVGETTDGMVQSSAAVQELSHMAQELRHVMEGLQ